MGSKPTEPEDIVSDGVEEGSKPVPRDGGAADGASTPSGVAEGRAPEVEADAHQASAANAPETGDTHKAPGPAEEQDEQTADDRGLTTDTTPD